jgi:hypothetical protein
MAKDTLHVVPHENGWSVKREGNERASSTHGTQKEAIDSARGLAREGDDIVIHRPDGTIRERTTYTGAAEGNGNGSARERPELHDLVSVGSRVSWPAVIAGVAVAATSYLALTLLALAIGVSTIDTVQSRSFAIGATIVGIFNLLVALFLGGYVATRLATRETRGEAIVHGVLVWAALFFTMLLTGINMGGSFGMMSQVTRTADTEVVVIAPSPEQQRRADEIRARGEQLVSEMNPVAVAWWAFAGMALSVLAAVGGAVVGSGPELTFRRAPARVETERRVVTPQPA